MDRKRSEQTLHESDNRLRTIVEGTQALLVWVDANGRITNRAQLMERLDIHDVAGLVRYAIKKGAGKGKG